MTFWALIYKELRMGQVRIAIHIAFLLLMAGLLFYLIEYQSVGYLILAFMLIIAHFFYMFFVLLFSMHKEWSGGTAPFWLNTPLSGWSLIGAKYVSAFIQFLISLTITYVMTYVLIQRAVQNAWNLEISGALRLSFLFIVLVSASLGAIAVFIYTMHRSIRTWGWLLALVLLVIFSLVWEKFTQTRFHKTLVEWGALVTIDQNHPYTISFRSLNGQMGTVEIQMETLVYMGHIVENVLFILILLGISSWLFNRKVEI